MDDYSVRSDEDSDDEPSELVNVETLVYEEVVQYCEWTQNESVSI